jgi:hypothetical protein
VVDWDGESEFDEPQHEEDSDAGVPESRVVLLGMRIVGILISSS